MRWNANGGLFLSGVLVLLTTISSSPRSASDPGREGRRARLEPHAALPLFFEANQGQMAGGAPFLARADTGTFLVDATGVSWTTASPLHAASSPGQRLLDLRLLGADPRARTSGYRPGRGRVHYYRDDQPGGVCTNVPVFAGVQSRQVYRGVDVVWYGQGRELEYDFVVAPGADPHQIRLGLAGASHTRIDAATGDLILTLGTRTVRQKRPVAYQQAGGRRRPVAAGYTLLAPGKGGTSPDHRIGFQLAAYDRTRELIIDPVLVYSTFVEVNPNNPALSDSRVLGATVAANGDALVAGNLGAVALFARYDPEQAGVASLVYQAFLGNSDGRVVVQDAQDRTYIGGQTSSNALPTVAPLMGDRPGVDGYLGRLSATGIVEFLTYFGGGASEAVDGITITPNGRVFFTGFTTSSDFPTTSNAEQRNKRDLADAYVTRLLFNGGSSYTLNYCTFLGGRENDEANAIASDTGFVAVVGSTDSPNFPTKRGGLSNPPVFQNDQGGTDAFVALFNDPPGDVQLLRSTYLGGVGTDIASGAAQQGDDTFVVGVTGSVNFPGPTTAIRGPNDGFCVRLRDELTAVNGAVFLGGDGSDSATAVARGFAGVWISGFTRSDDFPVVAPLPGQGQLHESTGGFVPTFRDAWLMKLDLNFATPNRFSTYLGGLGEDQGLAVGVRPGPGVNTDRVVIGGFTRSDDFPVLNAHQDNRRDRELGFVTVVNDSATSGGAGLSGFWDNLRLICTRPGRLQSCRVQGAFVVQSQGSDNARPTVLRLFLSEDDTLDAGDPGLLEFPIPAIPVGGVHRVRLLIRNVPNLTGRRLIGVVDALDQIAEPNEANNVVVSARL